MEFLLRTRSVGTSLTPEQTAEFLKMAGAGLSDVEVARRLGLSPTTVSGLRISNKSGLVDSDGG
jgi:DNA-binding CsgD family transcriptional regulator